MLCFNSRKAQVSRQGKADEITSLGTKAVEEERQWLKSLVQEFAKAEAKT
jgi:hypothetical protein